jgi:glycine/D-amino acid oxidase-like deaminating enzyme
MYDYVVIGKGMMGSAAARYLAERGAQVAIIGPDEPKNYANHDGIFASHYDEGRLTRLLGKDITWSWLSYYAIKNYRYLEEASGILFYRPCGLLYAVKEVEKIATFANQAEVENKMGGQHTTYPDSASITNAHPMVIFPQSYTGLFEHAPAGLLNPRAFVRAETIIAEKHGAEMIPEIAVKTEQSGDSITVTTRNGRAVTARKVLFAGGSFTNCYEVLPVNLACRVKTEFTILAEVSEETAQSLSDMPCLIYEIESSQIDGIYLTPPLRYPDGKFYIKMGCDTKDDLYLTDLGEMQSWMQTGSASMLAEMSAAIQSFMPDLKFLNFLMKPCLVTYTAHGKPYIDQVKENLFVAIGGNGASAKCADTLGTLAAQLLLGEEWLPEFNRQMFQVVLT